MTQRVWTLDHLFESHPVHDQHIFQPSHDGLGWPSKLAMTVIYMGTIENINIIDCCQIYNTH